MSLKNRTSNGNYFCEKCRAQDPKAGYDRNSAIFSEAKEDETECYYCSLKGINKGAEVLLEGLPSCRECRKNKNVINYVANT
jgi:hypothetical protein